MGPCSGLTWKKKPAALDRSNSPTSSMRRRAALGVLVRLSSRIHVRGIVPRWTGAHNRFNQSRSPFHRSFDNRNWLPLSRHSQRSPNSLRMFLSLFAVVVIDGGFGAERLPQAFLVALSSPDADLLRVWVLARLDIDKCR